MSDLNQYVGQTVTVTENWQDVFFQYVGPTVIENAGMFAITSVFGMIVTFFFRGNKTPDPMQKKDTPLRKPAARPMREDAPADWAQRAAARMKQGG